MIRNIRIIFAGGLNMAALFIGRGDRSPSYGTPPSVDELKLPSKQTKLLEL